MSAFFWCFQAAIVAVVCGYGLARRADTLPTTILARFFIGVAAFPAALGLWVLVLGFLLPGQNVLLFAYGPGVVCLALGAYWVMGDRAAIVNAIGTSLIQEVRQFRETPLPQLAALASILVLTFVAGSFLATQAWQPTAAGDAVQYLNEALHIAHERSSSELLWFRGSADGAIRGDIHSPIWPLYLANALMASLDVLGFPNDVPSRFAFLLCVPTVFIALTAVIITLRPGGWILPLALASGLMAILPEYGFAIAYRSRDSLRLAALVLFMAVLLSLKSAMTGRTRLTPATFAVVALAGAFVSASHAFGSIVGPIILAAWVIAWTWGGAGLRKIVPVASAAMLGLAAGSCTLLASLAVTGTLTGNNITADSVLAGTQYAATFDALHRARVPGYASPLLAWLSAMSIQTRAICLLGAAAALWICAIVLGRKIAGRDTDFPHSLGPETLFLSLGLLGLFGVNAGLFDLPSLRISTWFAMNPRYGLHVYLICIILLSFLGGRALTGPLRLEADGSPPGRISLNHSRTPAISWRFRSLAASATIVLVTFYGVRNVRETWSADFSSLFDLFRNIRQVMPSDSCRQMTEVEQTIYYLPNPATNLYSQSNRGLFMLDSPGAVVDELDRRGVCAVLGYSNFYLSHFPADSPLKAALEDPTKFNKYAGPDSYIILYLRRGAAAPSAAR